MQLYLKEGVSTEYAMHKPPEDEIWPETKPVEFHLWPRMLPDGLENPTGEYDAVWNLEKLDGAQMKMKLEGHPREYFDRVALIWSVHETHRTHCPRCGEKIEGSPWFIGSDFGGHQAFLCPANDDWDERFPREW